MIGTFDPLEARLKALETAVSFLLDQNATLIAAMSERPAVEVAGEHYEILRLGPRNVLREDLKSLVQLQIKNLCKEMAHGSLDTDAIRRGEL